MFNFYGAQREQLGHLLTWGPFTPRDLCERLWEDYCDMRAQSTLNCWKENGFELKITTAKKRRAVHQAWLKLQRLESDLSRLPLLLPKNPEEPNPNPNVQIKKRESNARQHNPTSPRSGTDLNIVTAAHKPQTSHTADTQNVYKRNATLTRELG